MPYQAPPLEVFLGRNNKKRQAGHFREAFLGGGRGLGAEVKNTQEKTTAAHALPQVDNADGRTQRGPALRKSQVNSSQRAQADIEGHGAAPR
jgi:hypothetical protein